MRSAILRKCLNIGARTCAEGEVFELQKNEETRLCCCFLRFLRSFVSSFLFFMVLSVGKVLASTSRKVKFSTNNEACSGSVHFLDHQLGGKRA